MRGLQGESTKEAFAVHLPLFPDADDAPDPLPLPVVPEPDCLLLLPATAAVTAAEDSAVDLLVAAVVAVAVFAGMCALAPVLQPTLRVEVVLAEEDEEDRDAAAAAAVDLEPPDALEEDALPVAVAELQAPCVFFLTLSDVVAAKPL